VLIFLQLHFTAKKKLVEIVVRVSLYWESINIALLYVGAGYFESGSYAIKAGHLLESFRCGLKSTWALDPSIRPQWADVFWTP
jgi:hypothetical protein